jgi:hypothetical protein
MYVRLVRGTVARKVLDIIFFYSIVLMAGKHILQQSGISIALGNHSHYFGGRYRRHAAV